jgi:hypothetical protein
MAKKKTLNKTGARKKNSQKSVAHKNSVKKGSTSKKVAKKWSGRVAQKSKALDLEAMILKYGSAKKITQSLLRSARQNGHRKGTPFQAAMSTLDAYTSRDGKKLSERQKKIIEQSKNELRKALKRHYEDT